MSEHADPVAEPALDLDAIERDLADVEVALTRLDAGTYWTDEITGADLPADVLAANPTARRLA
jgi:RNA polymerase-binding transcription factor DksA